LLGYSRSFTHRKDGPGAARPWWVQGEALAAGGDLAGFSSEQSIASFSSEKEESCSFLKKRTKRLLSGASRAKALSRQRAATSSPA
jgi:hypothetical protein